MTTAKQIGQNMMVTNTYKTESVSEGDTVTFNYYGQQMTGKVTGTRYSSTYNDLMVYVDNPNCGELQFSKDDIHTVKTTIIDMNTWVVGQMLESGLITIQEAMAELA